MADTITLTTPIAQPSISGYAPGSLYLGYAEGRIVATIIGNDGKGQVFEYPDAGTSTDTVAKTKTLIQTLGTTNLVTRSMWQRVFDRLVADFPSRFNGGATVG
jgi:hypothetical protein